MWVCVCVVVREGEGEKSEMPSLILWLSSLYNI